MENKELENLIETSWNSRDEINERTVGKIKEAVEQTLNLLGDGSLRVAEKTTSGEWVVNQWTKKAVLLSFRLREMELQKGGHKTQPGGTKWIANLKAGEKKSGEREISELFQTLL